MAELLSKPAFREALEDAIKGREAKNASFSQAWANGELTREHFARWAENHYHYVGPFADYLGYIYSNTPDYAKGMRWQELGFYTNVGVRGNF